MLFNFTRPSLAVIAISVLAVTASACGSSTKTTSSTTKSTSAAKPATTASTPATTATTASTSTGASTSPAAGGTLVGNVGAGGDAFKISLMQGSSNVTTLKPGNYTFKISDDSTIHNFHITGPGLNQATSIPGTGAKVFKATLQPGTYTYQCDAHAAAMKGSFTVA